MQKMLKAVPRQVFAISLFLLMFSCINAASGDGPRNQVSWPNPDQQEAFKKTLEEFGIPYEIKEEYGHEFIVWPQEYSDKVEIISRNFGAGPNGKVEMLFELGRPNEAIALLKTLAKEGNATSQQNLGLYYVLGEFVEQDYERARELYEAAIAGGGHNTLVNLGTLYENGWGVKQDDEKAFALYQKAAVTHQDVAGMCKVGHFYEDGKAGLKKNSTKARDWYEQARIRSNINLDCTNLR